MVQSGLPAPRGGWGGGIRGPRGGRGDPSAPGGARRERTPQSQVGPCCFQPEGLRRGLQLEDPYQAPCLALTPSYATSPSPSTRSGEGAGFINTPILQPRKQTPWRSEEICPGPHWVWSSPLPQFIFRDFKGKCPGEFGMRLKTLSLRLDS